MNVCKHIFSLFFSNSNIFSKIAMPGYFPDNFFFHGHVKYTFLRTNDKSNIYKAMFMHNYSYYDF